MTIKLPEKVKRFWVLGVLVLALLLFAGGLYFRHRGLLLSTQTIAPEESGGTVSGALTGIPEKFPADVPLFEPAEILSGLESNERIQVTLQTNAPAKRILEFYQQKMDSLGWILTGRSTANDNSVLTFLKNERQTQIVIISEPEGSTLIILSITS